MRLGLWARCKSAEGGGTSGCQRDTKGAWWVCWMKGKGAHEVWMGAIFGSVALALVKLVARVVC